jgi:hypothetical protein
MSNDRAALVPLAYRLGWRVRRTAAGALGFLADHH